MASRGFDRLVDTGNVLIDVVLDVPALPERGGDVLATSTVSTTGGGFNVMAAAARLGLRTAYAGLLGTGARAAQARADLRAEGIEVLTAPVDDRDTGFVVCLVEPDGERTFVTSFGAESDTRRALPTGGITGRDAVYITGYSLVDPAAAARVHDLLSGLPDTSTLVFDPGPLVADADAAVLTAVLTRADVLTGNAREGALLAGSPGLAGPDIVIARLRPFAPRALVVLRRDRSGALVSLPDDVTREVPAYPVTAVDANGAGDAHTGALLAALARGDSADHAVRYANAAAAFAVTRRGPATGPTTDQLERFLADHAPSSVEI